jgi:uncharacterized protein
MRTRLLVLAALWPAFAVAQMPEDHASHRLDLAIELLAQLDMDRMMDGMQGQMEAVLREQLATVADCEAMQPAVEAFASEAGAVIVSGLKSDLLMPEIAQLYAEVFDEQELQGLLDFYRSPLGEKMMAKMPELMERSMTLAQAQMGDVMAQIEPIAARFHQQSSAARKDCPAQE